MEVVEPESEDREGQAENEDNSPREDDYVLLSNEDAPPRDEVDATTGIPEVIPGDAVVIMVAGKVGNGKSTALNNVFGLNLGVKSSPTAVTQNVCSTEVVKNGVKFLIIDTPGLGSAEMNTEKIVEEMADVTRGLNFVLLYCLGVRPNDILTETDVVIVRNLQHALGVKAWQKCVLLLTFSDITLNSEFPLPHQVEEYKAFLADHAKQFQNLLQQESHVDIWVKTIFDYPSEEDRENEESSESVIAIPVKKERNVKFDILPGISNLYQDWTDVIVIEVMKKKDARERVLPMIALGSDMGMVQHSYLKILAGGAVGAVVGTGVGMVTGIVGGPFGLLAGALLGAAVGGTVGLPIYKIVEILKAKPGQSSSV